MILAKHFSEQPIQKKHPHVGINIPQNNSQQATCGRKEGKFLLIEKILEVTDSHHFFLPHFLG